MSAPYLYWLVRYVPNVARGEQVNVAVIMGRDGGDWAIQAAPNLRRASRLGGDASALRPWLQSLEEAINNHEQPPLQLFVREPVPVVSQAWIGQLSHRFNNVLQVSAPAPVEASSAHEGASFLYDILVAVPQPAERSRTRTRLVRDLGALYERTGAFRDGQLFRRPRAQVGRQRGRFDFAVVDGGVDQISQAFAFDVRDVELLERELQSWNFIVSRLRQDGADIFSGAREIRAVNDVPISVGYQEPARFSSDRAREVYEAAIEAWNGLGVNAVPSTQLDQIAAEASELLAA